MAIQILIRLLFFIEIIIPLPQLHLNLIIILSIRLVKGYAKFQMEITIKKSKLFKNFEKFQIHPKIDHDI